MILGMLIAAASQGVAPAVTTIISGWDTPTQSELRSYLPKTVGMPFNGTAVKIKFANGAFPFQTAFSRQTIDASQLPAVEADLKAIQTSNSPLKANFIQINAGPGNITWASDADWSSVVESFRQAAWLAKRTGMKGILFDPEPYQKWDVFQYAVQPDRTSYSLPVMQSRAEARGQQVMQAIAAEYPDITILCYHFLNASPRVKTSTGFALLPFQYYDLLPSFYKGWFNVMPATTTIVDANGTSFRTNSLDEFASIYNKSKFENGQMLGSSAQSLYSSRVKVGFAFYLDAYLNPPGSAWNVTEEGTPPVDLLEQNLTFARRVGAEYIWIYGEKSRWFPTSDPTATYWPDKFPGIVDSVSYATQSTFQKFWLNALPQLEGPYSSTELLKNPSLIGNFNSFSTWQAEPTGTFTSDASGSIMTSVKQGCFVQLVPVLQGETYFVSVEKAESGNAVGSVNVQFKDSNLLWMPSPRMQLGTRTLGTNWQKVSGYITVPEGATRLGVLLTSTSFGEPSSVAKFRNASVRKVN